MANPTTPNTAQAAQASADPTKQPTAKTLTPPPFTISALKTNRKYIKILVYGAFGTGKTSFAGSSVDVDGMRDVLMVNAESGTMSIEDAEHIVHRDLIDQVRTKDFKTVALVQEFLIAHCKARDNNDIMGMKRLQARMFSTPDQQIRAEEITEDEDEEGPYRMRRYNTVIIDSLTEVDVFSMYHLLGIQTDMKLDKDIDVAQFAEFRKNNQMMQLLVRAYRDLEMNVILVCSTQFNQDELKRMLWTPSLTGQLKGQVQGFVDIVGFLQVGKPAEGSKEIPRRLFVQPIGQFDAKNRIASFKEPFITQPTMGKIMDAFRQANKNPGKASPKPKDANAS